MIRLGPIDSVTMHLMTSRPEDADRAVPRTLCIDAGGSFTSRSLNTFTTAPEKVTCTDCLEWMHA